MRVLVRGGRKLRACACAWNQETECACSCAWRQETRRVCVCLCVETDECVDTDGYIDEWMIRRGRWGGQGFEREWGGAGG